MATRTQLIERKNEVIGARAAAQRRLAQVQGATEPHNRRQAAALAAEIRQLQDEERRLRLAIDRTPQTHPLPARTQPMQTTYDVLITAGYDRDKVDALALATGQPQKALIPIAGQPMIWHTVRALDESGLAGEIVIVGLDENDAPDFGRPVHYVPDQGSMTANQRSGAERLQEINRADRYILAAGGDAPLITGEMIRWFIEACRPFDKAIYWGIVEQQVMEAVFPSSKRTYLRLREGKFCSGDLFLVDLAAGLRVHHRMERFFNSRKDTFRLVRMLGIGTIFNFLIGRLSLPGLLAVAERELGVQGAPILLPFAEVGMDIDKPHQLAQVAEYLATHAAHPVHTRPRPRTEPGERPVHG